MLVGLLGVLEHRNGRQTLQALLEDPRPEFPIEALIEDGDRLDEIHEFLRRNGEGTVIKTLHSTRVGESVEVFFSGLGGPDGKSALTVASDLPLRAFKQHLLEYFDLAKGRLDVVLPDGSLLRHHANDLSVGDIVSRRLARRSSRTRQARPRSVWSRKRFSGRV